MQCQKDTRPLTIATRIATAAAAEITSAEIASAEVSTAAVKATTARGIVTAEIAAPQVVGIAAKIAGTGLICRQRILVGRPEVAV